MTDLSSPSFVEVTVLVVLVIFAASPVEDEGVVVEVEAVAST